jgi:hypothetical protein
VMGIPLRGNGWLCAALAAVIINQRTGGAQEIPPGRPAGAPERGLTGRMDAIGAPPADHVLDEAHIFATDQRKRLGDLLVTAARRDGTDVYVATFTFIDGETTEGRAERLKERWCLGEFGLVLVHDRGSQNLTFSARTHQAMPITVSELEGLFQRANEAAQAPETPGEKLVALVETLLPLLEGKVAIQRRLQREVISAEQWWVFGAVAAALLLMLVVFLVVWRLRQRVRAALPPPAFFPTVTVAARFGAGFGGGSMAEVRFPVSPPPPRGIVSA